MSYIFKDELYCAAKGNRTTKIPQSTEISELTNCNFISSLFLVTQSGCHCTWERMLYSDLTCIGRQLFSFSVPRSDGIFTPISMYSIPSRVCYLPPSPETMALFSKPALTHSLFMFPKDSFSKPRFCNLYTIDILGRIDLSSGVELCIVGYLEATLASTH
jgi:hypothetical protein